jgi:hypothetical protein
MALRPTRIQVNIKANYTLKGFQGEGHIVDVSTGGLGIEVKQIFVIGDLVRIVFRLPNAPNDEVDFWGVVRSVSGNVVGVRYEEISKENMERVDRYVATLILANGKAARENFE